MAALVRLCFVAIFMCGLALPEAHADNDTKRAGKHVVEGDRLKKRAEEAKAGGREAMAKRLFAASAFEYRSAYDLVPHPLMLYNLAQVARLTGKDTRALRLYRRFLNEQPTGAAADYARKYVKILKKSLKAEEDKAENENEGEEEGGNEGEEEEVDPDLNPGADEDPILDDPQPDESSGDSGKDMQRYAGIGLAATGLLSIAVGAKFGLDAQSISSTLSNHDSPWTDKEIRLDKEGEDAAKKMLIFTGVGAAALVGGGLLYYFSREDSKGASREEALHFAPSVDRQSVSLGLVGAF